MNLQSLLDLYWSKDFLLNISAEVLGLVAEIVVVTIFIGKYLDGRELRQWKFAFSARASRLLEEHREMPNAIAQMKIADPLSTPHKIVIWLSRVDERVRDALALIPPTLDAKGYLAVECYLERIRDLSRKFADQEMPISLLRDLNDRAKALAVVTSLPHPESYLWTEETFLALESQLKVAEW